MTTIYKIFRGDDVSEQEMNVIFKQHSSAFVERFNVIEDSACKNGSRILAVIGYSVRQKKAA